MTEITSLAILNGFSTGWLHQFIEEIGSKQPYNPVADWILSAPWDGTDRLQEVYDTLWALEDYPPELKEALIKRWLLSATQAALAKGDFKARGVLTLQGPQGLGKTSWFAALMPPGDLRNDCILLDHHMDGSNKDSIINAINHWVVEIGELDSSFRKDVARLKGFLTNGSDKLRRPYGKDVMEYPRRTVFAATVNEDRFLIDHTGNSRWWTIPVQGIRHNHNIDMQQLFAQLALLLETEKWWLTKSEERQLAEYNLRHRAVSAIAERLLDHINLEATLQGSGTYRTATELLGEIEIKHPTNAQAKECGAALRELVGMPKRVNGRDKWRVCLRGEKVYPPGYSAF
jgi:putative DNA primase/helicase